MRLSQHAPALDGVRGTAALLVLVGHLGNRDLFLIPGVEHELLGKSGVWLFFALSAFLLTGRLTEELETSRDSRGSLATYALNRVFRIFPLYWIVIAAHWLIGDFSARMALKHLVLLAGWGELWAIPVEFQYYFAIPLVAAFTVRFGRARGVQALSAALALAFLYDLARPELVFRNSGYIYGKLVPFLAGSLGALLALGRGVPARSTWRSVVLPALVAAGLGLATAAYREMELANQGYREAVLDSRFAAPILSLALAGLGTMFMSLGLEANWLARVLGSAPLAFFGRVSFSLYLWHDPIIRNARALGLEHGPPTFRGWLYFGASTLAAWISYRLIERPGMELGRRLGRRLRAR